MGKFNIVSLYKIPKQTVRKPTHYEEGRLSDYYITKTTYFSELIFLPFQLHWKFLVSLSIVASSVLSLSLFVLDGRLNYFKLSRTLHIFSIRFIILVASEVIFLIDLVLLTLHKLARRLQVTRIYKPISVVQLVVGYITIIFSAISMTLFFTRDESSPLKVLRLLITLRLYRCFSICNYLIRSTYINEIVFISVCQMIFVVVTSLLTFIVILWWLYTAITNNLTAKEMLIKEIPKMNKNVFDSWPVATQEGLLLRAFCIAANCLFGRGPYAATFDNVYILFFDHLWMMMTLIIRLSMIGIFVAILVSKHRRNAEFNSIQETLTSKILNMDLRKSTYKAIVRFYNTLWTHRAGIIDSEVIFDVLPSGLINDTSLDIYITMMKHSHLLRNVDKTFAAALATEMENIFHNKGDIIYKKGMTKDTMWYISLGALHLMSSYDDMTPIVTLGPGTCFGETSLLVSYPVQDKITCATHCELQMLTKDKFLKVCKRFPDEFRLLQQEVSERYNNAKLLVAMKEIIRSRNIDDKVGLHENGPMKRLKRIARAIDVKLFSKSNFKFDQEDKLDRLADKEKIRAQYLGTCSDYLDSFAFTDFIPEEEESTFVRTSCPVVFRSNSPFIKLWNVIVHASVFYMIFTIPYEAGLGKSVSSTLHTASLIMQVVFILDLIVQCLIAIHIPDKRIDTTEKIFHYRLNTLAYRADIIGSMPFNFFVLLTYNERSWTLGGLLKLNYTLRAWRIVKLCNHLIARSYVYKELVIALTSAFYFLIFICYWSMIFGVLSCYDNKCNRNAMWMQIEGTQETRENVLWVTITTMRSTLMLCMGAAGGYIFPFTRAEHVAHVFMACMFFYVETFTVSSFCFAIIHKKLIHQMGTAIDNPMLNLLSRYTISSEIRFRIFKQLKLQKMANDIHHLHGTEQLLGLSIHLRREIKMSVWLNCILQVPLFMNIDKKILYEIIDKCRIRLFPKNDIICYSGVITNDMYIIKSGYCEIIPLRANDVPVVKGPGWSFGVLEVLLNIPRIKTIRCVTDCECMVISKIDIRKLLSDFPDCKEDINATKRKCEVLMSIPVVEGFDVWTYIKMQEEKSFYHFGYNLIVGSKAENEFLKPFGRYTFLRVFLLRTVILPTGYTIWIMEIIRSFFATISCFCFPAIIIFYYYSVHYSLLFYALDFTAFIDLYIRLHVAYYNDEGVLIVHPLLTARHYLNTSFVIDLLGCFPFEVFFSHLIPGVYASYWLCYNRLIQLHRVIGLLNHIQSRKLKPTTMIIMVKYFIIIEVFINFLASILFIRSCDVEEDTLILAENSVWKGIQCPTIRYNHVVFGNTVTPFKIYIFYHFYVTTFLTQMNVHNFGSDNNNPIIQFFISFIGFIAIAYMSSEIGVFACLKNTGLMYQQKVKELLRFLKKNGVNKELQDEFSRYYDTLWEKHHGENMRKSLRILNKALQADIFYNIYGMELKHHTVFARSNTAFFRSLLSIFDVQVFHKGSLVINESFVHGKVYLIFEGYVSVLTGRRLVTTIKKGAFFGNLLEVGQSQQTLNVVANTTVEVLVTSTSQLYHVLNACPHYKQLFVYSLKHQCNQGICIVPSALGGLNEDEKNSTPVTAIKSSSRLVSNKYEVFKAMIALMSSCGTMYTIATQDFTIIWVLILFVIDVITGIIIILNCYTPYKDKINEYVTDSKSIRLNYRRRKYGFWFDFLTTFPLECLWFCFADMRYAYLVLRFNRMIRYLHFRELLSKYQKHISSNQFKIRVLCLLINIYTLLFVMSGSYLFVFLYYQDKYRAKSTGARIGQFCQLLSNLMCDFAHYPREMMPITCMMVVIFRNMQMVIIVIVIALIMGHVLFYAETFYYDLLKYVEKKDAILATIKIDGLCKYLYTHVESYLNFLWDFSHGSQQPEILSLAPHTLQQNLLKTLYDHHIENHFIFGKCQQSFTDQIMLHFKRELILPGNVIVRKSTKDESMYFIHEGQVSIYGRRYNDETLAGFLNANNYFGTRQGLFKAIPHSHTYKAHSTVIVLKLDLSSWSYLLPFYPVEKNRIYSILEREGEQHKFNT